jgi:hypothetical protein
MRDNMDVDSDKSLQDEVLRVTTGQIGPSEPDDDQKHKVCCVFPKFMRDEQLIQ